MDLDHIYTEEVLDSPGFNSARDFYLDHIKGPFVLHGHLRGKACTGNCPVFGAPNEDDPRPSHQPDGTPITYEWDVDDPHAYAHSVLCECSVCLSPDN